MNIKFKKVVEYGEPRYRVFANGKFAGLLKPAYNGWGTSLQFFPVTEAIADCYEIAGTRYNIVRSGTTLRVDRNITTAKRSVVEILTA